MDFPVTHSKMQAFVDAYAASLSDKINESIGIYLTLDPKAILEKLETKLRECVRQKAPWTEFTLFLGDLGTTVRLYNYHTVKRALEKRLQPLLTTFFPTAAYTFDATSGHVHLIFTLPEASGQTSNPSQ